MATLTESLRAIFHGPYNNDNASILWSMAETSLRKKYAIKEDQFQAGLSHEGWFAHAENQIVDHQTAVTVVLTNLKEGVDYHNDVQDSFSRKFNWASLFLTLVGGTLIALSAAGVIGLLGGLIGGGVLVMAIVIACTPFSRMKINFSMDGNPPVEPQKSCKDRILAQFFKPAEASEEIGPLNEAPVV